MIEYIDREALLREFDELEPYEDYESEHALWLDMRMKVINAPAADVAPVRHGRWEKISIDISEDLFRCSEWGHLAIIPPDTECEFCPTCRAKIDGGED